MKYAGSLQAGSETDDWLPQSRSWHAQMLWLKGSGVDALHVVLSATGFNLKWLLRAIARMSPIAPVLLYALVRQFIMTTEKLVLLMTKPVPTIRLARS